MTILGKPRHVKLLTADIPMDEQQHRTSESPIESWAWITTSQPSAGCQSTTEFVNTSTRQYGRHHDSLLLESPMHKTCWSLLLDDLHQAEAKYEEFGAYTSLDNTKFLRLACKTWKVDSKLQQPLVTISVHDLGIIACRLGLEWRVFKPEEGIVSATGSNRVLYSTFEPSLGTLVHYTFAGDAALHSTHPPLALERENVYIPTRQTAMLGFGLLPGCSELGLPDYHIGSIEEVYTTLNQLDPTCKASQRVRDVRGIESTCTFGFSDLIPMAAPMLRLRGSTIIRVPVLTEHCVGLTCHTPGLLVFFHRLQEHIKDTEGFATDQRRWVEYQFRQLGESFSEWENEVMANRQANNRDLRFLESVHDCWDHTTEYFCELQNNHQYPLRYADLLATHIKHVVNYWNDAWASIRGGSNRDYYGYRNWIAEGAHCYWDYLPNIATELNAKCGVDEKVVNEAWIMMMFRAMCWWRCHWMMEGNNMVKDDSRLPTRYWGSQQTAHIG